MLQVRLLDNLGAGWARLLTVTGVLDPRDRRRGDFGP